MKKRQLSAGLFFGLTAFISLAQANPYDECMLARAGTLKDSSTDAIDVVAEACIKSTEQPVDPTEGAKIEFKFSYGEMTRGMRDAGLIIQVYNGSAYDITALTVGLTDKKTHIQRLYKRDVWYSYNRGPGFITSYGPRYKTAS